MDSEQGAGTTGAASTPQQTTPLDTWAIVELMGHVRLAGKLTEESHFGVALGRLDVPMPDGSFTTQFFGGSSVYRITPASEEIARQIAMQAQGQPVSRWEVRHLMPPVEDAPASDDLVEVDIYDAPDGVDDPDGDADEEESL